MHRNWLFWGLLAFWVFMNTWLWRLEYGRSKQTGDHASTSIVWQRILTAPDHSVMEVSYRGKRIGFFRWMPNIGESGANMSLDDDQQVEGIVKHVSDYRINVEGNIMMQITNRMTFGVHMRFDTNQVWQEISAKFGSRLGSIQLHTTSSSQELQMQLDFDGSKWEQNISRSALVNPDQLIREFGLPIGMLWPGWSMIASPETPGKIQRNISWGVYNDWWKVGHSHLRVYRIELQILNRFVITFIISRVGEILRIEFPSELTAVNEAFLSW